MLRSKRGDGCFIGTSVAFWDAYWNNWQDGGPLPKSVTKDVADLSEVDLGTLFQFVGENYTCLLYTSPSPRDS